jgi:hypothetical protein
MLPVFPSRAPLARRLLLTTLLLACAGSGDTRGASPDGMQGDASALPNGGQGAPGGYGDAPNGAQPGGQQGAEVRPTSPLPPDALMLQRVSIDDPGVITPGPAMSVLVPMGWRTTGGVTSGGGSCSEAYAVNWQAASPDGQSTVSIFPTEVWVGSNTTSVPGCMRAAFGSAREYLEARVQRAFQGVRLLDYRERPDYASSAMEYAQRTEQLARSMGNGMRVRADGGELLFAYTQNGVEMRGMAGVTAVIFMSQLPNPMGGAPLTTTTGATLGSFGATAPNGQLNFELVEATRRSIVPNGPWLQKLFALQEQMGNAAVQGTRERAAIIVAGGAAATKSNIESFQRMSGYDRATSGSGGGELYPGEATDDRIQRRSLEAIRGVDTYMDPVSNTPVQLDHTYGNAWRVNNQDAYILTKNPNFNPGQYGIEATQMKVIR